MSEDCHDSNIVACCAHCGFIFDATRGLQCPSCQRNQIAYAWQSDQPAEFWNRNEPQPEEYVNFTQLGRLIPNHVARPAGRVPDFTDLSPYAHVLNRHGSDCIPECDACMWAEEQAREKKLAQPSVDECERIFRLQDPRN